MNMLVSGVLLKDIGKVKLPEALLRLEENERSEEQEAEYRLFVDYGVETLKTRLACRLKLSILSAITVSALMVPVIRRD